MSAGQSPAPPRPAGWLRRPSAARSRPGVPARQARPTASSTARAAASSADAAVLVRYASLRASSRRTTPLERGGGELTPTTRTVELANSGDVATIVVASLASMEPSVARSTRSAVADRTTRTAQPARSTTALDTEPRSVAVSGLGDAPPP